MSLELPKLDRGEYRRKMREAFERTMEQVADAMNAAPCGRLIRDSEEKVRDSLEEFRRVAFETATQMKIDAAEAAFSPSEERDDRRPMRNKGQQPMSVLTVNGRMRLRRTRSTRGRPSRRLRRGSGRSRCARAGGRRRRGRRCGTGRPVWPMTS